MSYNDVTVKIDVASPIGVLGFGFPLIYAKAATGGGYDYAECNSLDEVVEAIAGFASSDTEQQRKTKTTAAKATKTYKAAELMFKQADPPSKIAVYSTASAATTALAGVIDENWRQLIVTAETGEDEVATIAAYIENTDKMYFCSTTDYTSVSITSYGRTICLYYADGVDSDSKPTSSVVCPEAAIVGAVAGKTAGSVNYKNMIIAGLTPLAPTTTVLNAVHTAGCLTIVKKSGDIVTTNGKTANGDYADITDGKDYIIQQVTYQVQKVLNTNDRVPYTDAGIAMLESACVNVMVDAYSNGIIGNNDDDTPAYTVTFGLKSETTAEDRKARKYILGSFTFSVVGAVDTVEIKGTIEI